MKKTLSSLIAIAATALLTACGGGGGGGEPAPTQVVATPTATVAATATTTVAVTAVPFSFPSGIPAMGTTSATTLTFTDKSATPAFTVASAEGTASGITTFGSCHFRILASTFPTGHKMALGNIIDVEDCNIVVDTKNMSVDAPAENRSIALVLGGAASSGAIITVDVNAGGQLTLNGNSVGTVTIQVVTGA